MYKFLEQVTADAMTRNAKTVSRGVTLRELELLFERDDFNAYPVEENSQVIGLVSKFDFLACFVFTPAHMIPRYQDLMRRTVANIMVPDFIYVREETKLTRVLQLMVDHRIEEHAGDRGRSEARGHDLAGRRDAFVAALRQRIDTAPPSAGPMMALAQEVAERIDQLAFARLSSSGEFRYIPDIASTQHR